MKKILKFIAISFDFEEQICITSVTDIRIYF